MAKALISFVSFDPSVKTDGKTLASDCANAGRIGINYNAAKALISFVSFDPSVKTDGKTLASDCANAGKLGSITMWLKP